MGEADGGGKHQEEHHGELTIDILTEKSRSEKKYYKVGSLKIIY